MRFLIRRVYAASVECAESTVGQIANGLVVYVGVANDDEITDIEWGVKKILGIRIFEDKSGKMNLPISEKMGILVISQFTLYGNLKKGYRPSFNRAAPPDLACSMYDKFVEILGDSFPGFLQTGKFGAHMRIALVENGPVTIWLDSQNSKY